MVLGGFIGIDLVSLGSTQSCWVLLGLECGSICFFFRVSLVGSSQVFLKLNFVVSFTGVVPVLTAYSDFY